MKLPLDRNQNKILKKIKMEREGFLILNNASVFDLRDLPSHVKHVRVGLLHARLPGTRRIMWTRDGRLEKC